jgi:hypothetical protein
MGGGPFLFVIITYYCHFGVFVLAAVFSNRQQTVFLSLFRLLSCLSCGDEGPYTTTHLLLQCRLVL